ncbi:hypothetical protein ADUPG1_007898, partial [Aduncisulcus paluster]
RIVSEWISFPDEQPVAVSSEQQHQGSEQSKSETCESHTSALKAPTMSMSHIAQGESQSSIMTPSERAETKQKMYEEESLKLSERVVELFHLAVVIGIVEMWRKNMRIRKHARASRGIHRISTRLLDKRASRRIAANEGSDTPIISGASVNHMSLSNKSVCGRGNLFHQMILAIQQVEKELRIGGIALEEECRDREDGYLAFDRRREVLKEQLKGRKMEESISSTKDRAPKTGPSASVDTGLSSPPKKDVRWDPSTLPRESGSHYDTQSEHSANSHSTANALDTTALLSMSSSLLETLTKTGPVFIGAKIGDISIHIYEEFEERIHISAHSIGIEGVTENILSNKDISSISLPEKQIMALQENPAEEAKKPTLKTTDMPSMSNTIRIIPGSSSNSTDSNTEMAQQFRFSKASFKTHESLPNGGYSISLSVELSLKASIQPQGLCTIAAVCGSFVQLANRRADIQKRKKALLSMQQHSADISTRDGLNSMTSHSQESVSFTHESLPNGGYSISLAVELSLKASIQPQGLCTIAAVCGSFVQLANRRADIQKRKKALLSMQQHSADISTRDGLNSMTSHSQESVSFVPAREITHRRHNSSLGIVKHDHDPEETTEKERSMPNHVGTTSVMKVLRKDSSTTIGIIQPSEEFIEPTNPSQISQPSIQTQASAYDNIAESESTAPFSETLIAISLCVNEANITLHEECPSSPSNSSLVYSLGKMGIMASYTPRVFDKVLSAAPVVDDVEEDEDEDEEYLLPDGDIPTLNPYTIDVMAFSFIISESALEFVLSKNTQSKVRREAIKQLERSKRSSLHRYQENKRSGVTADYEYLNSISAKKRAQLEQESKGIFLNPVGKVNLETTCLQVSYAQQVGQRSQIQGTGKKIAVHIDIKGLNCYVGSREVHFEDALSFMEVWKSEMDKMMKLLKDNGIGKQSPRILSAHASPHDVDISEITEETETTTCGFSSQTGPSSTTGVTISSSNPMIDDFIMDTMSLIDVPYAIDITARVRKGMSIEINMAQGNVSFSIPYFFLSASTLSGETYLATRLGGIQFNIVSYLLIGKENEGKFDLPSLVFTIMILNKAKKKNRSISDVGKSIECKLEIESKHNVLEQDSLFSVVRVLQQLFNGLSYVADAVTATLENEEEE